MSKIRKGKCKNKWVEKGGGGEVRGRQAGAGRGGEEGGQGSVVGKAWWGRKKHTGKEMCVLTHPSSSLQFSTANEELETCTVCVGAQVCACKCSTKGKDMCAKGTCW